MECTLSFELYRFVYFAREGSGRDTGNECKRAREEGKEERKRKELRVGVEKRERKRKRANEGENEREGGR